MLEQVKQSLIDVNNYLKRKSLSAEVGYHQECSHMLRAGCNQIGINTTKENSIFSLSIYGDKKRVEGCVHSSIDNLKPVYELIERLAENLEFAPEIDFLTPMKPMTQADVSSWNVDEAVAHFDKSKMVDLYKKAFELFPKKDVEISGAFSAGFYGMGLINTLVDEPRYCFESDFNLELVGQLTQNGNKEMRVAQIGATMSDYQPEKLFEEFKRQYEIKSSTEQLDREPGQYDVILSADAMGDILMYSSYLTLHGVYFDYGMGMLKKDEHKLGDRIYGKNITIDDLPEDPKAMYPKRLASNGVERKNQVLFDEGKWNYLYDSDKMTCDRFGKEVNNSLSQSSMRLRGGAGPSNFDEMVKSITTPTIYIGYIHYMNFTNAAKGEFTGTSRFGTYLIEDGEIKAHLYNLRINDSFFHVFNNVEWLSSELRSVNASNSYGTRYAHAMTVPKYTLVKGLSITGSSGTSAKK